MSNCAQLLHQLIVSNSGYTCNCTISVRQSLRLARTDICGTIDTMHVAAFALTGMAKVADVQ